MPLLPLDEPSATLARLARHRSAPRPVPAAAAPPVRPSEVPPPAVLAGRRSVRAFADRALVDTDLARVLTAADQAQRVQWPPDRHGDPGLLLLVAAYRVDGLRSGLHAWRPAGGPGAGPSDGALEHLTGPGWLRQLPDRYAPAPALVLVGGPVRRAGAEGYHALLVRAGALGYAVWLAARARGLECSVFGSASPEVSTALPADPAAGTAHLFTVAVGHPPTA